MTLKNALRRLFSSLTPSPRSGRRSSVRPVSSCPLTLEALETRLTPAMHIWSGAGSTLWSDPANWSAGGSPAGDANADLVFPASGVTRFTSTDDLAEPTPIHSIRFDGAGYFLNATPLHFLDLGNDITANASGLDAIDISIAPVGDADHVLTVAADGHLALLDQITDGSSLSSLIKRGGGVLEFNSASNTYRNRTKVEAGTLRVTGNNGLGGGASPLEVDAGATLIMGNNFSSNVGSLSGAGNVTYEGGGLGVGFDNTDSVFSGNITGFGGLVKYGPGTLTLSGNNTYSLGTVINGGILRLGSDTALPSGPGVGFVGDGSTLDLANHNATTGSLDGVHGLLVDPAVLLGTGTLTINPDNQPGREFDGTISGSGSLVKIGSGTEVLGGDNGNFTGTTTINGGTLEIDGNQPLSAVTVAAGAVLSGTGTVGPVTVFGTLSPGSVANPTGTLSVAGDATFAGPVAIFAVELDGPGAGQYSQLSASGTVDLGTATALSVTIGYSSSSGDTFAGVITCANLANTFRAVPPGLQDSYSATDLDLSIV